MCHTSKPYFLYGKTIREKQRTILGHGNSSYQRHTKHATHTTFTDAMNGLECNKFSSAFPQCNNFQNEKSTFYAIIFSTERPAAVNRYFNIGIWQAAIDLSRCLFAFSFGTTACPVLLLICPIMLASKLAVWMVQFCALRAVLHLALLTKLVPVLKWMPRF